MDKYFPQSNFHFEPYDDDNNTLWQNASTFGAGALLKIVYNDTNEEGLAIVSAPNADMPNGFIITTLVDGKNQTTSEKYVTKYHFGYKVYEGGQGGETEFFYKELRYGNDAKETIADAINNNDKTPGRGDDDEGGGLDAGAFANDLGDGNVGLDVNNLVTSDVDFSQILEIADGQTLVCEYPKYKQDRQPVDIMKMLDCFKNIPNKGAKYSASLNVDIPINNDPSKMVNISKSDPGHVFVTLTKEGANGESISQSFGFYPLTSASSLSMDPVPSTIINNGNSYLPHQYNASMALNNLREDQFNAMITTAMSNSTNPYQLNGYNCTSYGLSIFNSINQFGPDLTCVPMTTELPIFGGIGLPGQGVQPPKMSPITFNDSPSGLYKTLKNLKDHGHSNIEVGVNKSAKTSKGECN